MIKFNYDWECFIGVAFPARFLGFARLEWDQGSNICSYGVFLALDLNEFSYLMIRSSFRLKVFNLPSSVSYESELEYLKGLYSSIREFVRVPSVWGQLGRMFYGFDTFGFYVATNLRKIDGVVSRNKILSLGMFPLYQLELLKDPPDINRYPITYKYDPFEGRNELIDGKLDPCDYSACGSVLPKSDGYGRIWKFIEIGFRNPKDIMIHPTKNQLKYWSDVFLYRLGVDIFRRL
jgi:hypothetical protein